MKIQKYPSNNLPFDGQMNQINMKNEYIVGRPLLGRLEPNES